MTYFIGRFRPGVARSGDELIIGACAIGTGGRVFVAASTVSVDIPVPRRKCQLVRISTVETTDGAGDADMSFSVVKRNNQVTPAADVLINDGASLVSGRTMDKAYQWNMKGTDAQRTFFPGDTCRVDLLAEGTVTTQPQAVLVAEWAVEN